MRKVDDSRATQTASAARGEVPGRPGRECVPASLLVLRVNEVFRNSTWLRGLLPKRQFFHFVASKGESRGVSQIRIYYLLEDRADCETGYQDPAA
jgi:hypothetical protein